MQSRKLQEKQDMKPMMKQTSAEAKTIALEAAKKGDVKL